jgi:hypothetical protein
MYDQQKLRGSVYDQWEWNSDDFKKINKTHFKMRVGTNGLSLKVQEATIFLLGSVRLNHL